MVADLCHLCFCTMTPLSEKSRINKLKWRGTEQKHAYTWGDVLFIKLRLTSGLKQVLLPTLAVLFLNLIPRPRGRIII
jgi:hypothetical protein